LQEATGKLDESAVKLRELESLVTSDHENIRDERKKAEELRNKQLQGTVHATPLAVGFGFCTKYWTVFGVDVQSCSSV
jgi:hypothetical protein